MATPDPSPAEIAAWRLARGLQPAARPTEVTEDSSAGEAAVPSSEGRASRSRTGSASSGGQQHRVLHQQRQPGGDQCQPQRDPDPHREWADHTEPSKIGSMGALSL